MNVVSAVVAVFVGPRPSRLYSSRLALFGTVRSQIAICPIVGRVAGAGASALSGAGNDSVSVTRCWAKFNGSAGSRIHLAVLTNCRNPDGLAALLRPRDVS